MKDVVITGANGYIGRYVVRAALEREWSVTAATRRRNGLPPSVRWIAYDLRVPPDADVFPLGALVVHLAADTAAGSAVDEEMEVLAAQRLLTVVRERNLRLVFVSSQTARADAPTSYGRAKWRIEQEVLRDGGAVIRPGMVYGGEAAGLFGQLVRLVGSRKALPAFRPAPRVQPVHVADLAEAILRIGERDDAAARCYKVAAEEPLAFDAFLRAIAEHRLRVRRVFVPVPLVVVHVALGTANALLRTKLDAGRLRSLADLPLLDSRHDLQALGLELRPLASGMHRSGSARRRRLQMEARALLRYVLGREPRPSLVRRYVRAIESVRDGEPLPFPPYVWRWRGWMTLLDDRRSPASVDTCEFSWRLDAAAVLAEATPAGAYQFLALPPRGGMIQATADLIFGGASEAFGRALRIVASSARRRVLGPRHV